MDALGIEPLKITASPGKDALEKRWQRLQSEFNRAVTKLKEMGAERVILIGSMAGDVHNPYGDIDLVVAMRIEGHFLDRLRAVCAGVHPLVAMDILVYTPEEFEKMKETDPFLAHVSGEGKSCMRLNPEKEYKRHHRFYVPTQYPGELPGGIPSESFPRKDDEEGMRAASEIIDFVA